MARSAIQQFSISLKEFEGKRNEPKYKEINLKVFDLDSNRKVCLLVQILRVIKLFFDNKASKKRPKSVKARDSRRDFNACVIKLLEGYGLTRDELDRYLIGADNGPFRENAVLAEIPTHCPVDFPATLFVLVMGPHLYKKICWITQGKNLTFPDSLEIVVLLAQLPKYCESKIRTLHSDFLTQQKWYILSFPLFHRIKLSSLNQYLRSLKNFKFWIKNVCENLRPYTYMPFWQLLIYKKLTRFHVKSFLYYAAHNSKWNIRYSTNMLWGIKHFLAPFGLNLDYKTFFKSDFKALLHHFWVPVKGADVVTIQAVCAFLNFILDNVNETRFSKFNIEMAVTMMKTSFNFCFRKEETVFLLKNHFIVIKEEGRFTGIFALLDDKTYSFGLPLNVACAEYIDQIWCPIETLLWCKANSPIEFIFWNDKGKRMSTKMLGDIFSTYSKMWLASNPPEVPKNIEFRYQSWRASRACYLLDMGVEFRVVERSGRWSPRSNTLETIYFHKDRINARIKEARQMTDMLNEYIPNMLKQKDNSKGISMHKQNNLLRIGTLEKLFPSKISITKQPNSRVAPKTNNEITSLKKIRSQPPTKITRKRCRARRQIRKPITEESDTEFESSSSELDTSDIPPRKLPFRKNRGKIASKS